MATSVPRFKAITICLLSTSNFKGYDREGSALQPFQGSPERYLVLYGVPSKYISSLRMTGVITLLTFEFFFLTMRLIVHITYVISNT